jgi:cell division protease FtsH
LKEKKRFNGGGFLLLILLGILLYAVVSNYQSKNDISYAQLRRLFEEEKVTEFVIVDTRLTATLTDGTKATCDLYDFDLFYEDMNDLVVQQKAAGVIKDYDYHADRSGNWLRLLMPYFLGIMAFVVLMTFIIRMTGVAGGGNDKLSRFGEARIQSLPEGKKKVTFRDVAGADEEKEELAEIVAFLRSPQKFLDLGAHIPKGVLLVGPPGTGKTLLAKAVAGEADVGFLSISGSDFVEMYVGVGASRVRHLFEEAKKQAPAIVFIDEIDAVGRQRGSGLGGGHDEREQTLNQLLVEMDGFTSNEGVVVLAATNRVDILDPALLRPGRFDRQVYVGLPDIKGREEILKIHARNKPLAEDVDLSRLAKGTPGFTGADLENLLNEAALLAGRRDLPAVDMATLEEAMIKVIAGPEKRSRVIPESERRLTAYHEAGHAVVMRALPDHDPVHQITIVPRGQTGGLTISLPDEDRSYLSRTYLTDRIAALLGGRAAEQMILGDISTGASNDIQRATAMARKMVGTYGMSDKLGSVAFDAGHDEVFIGKSMAQTRPYSDKTAAEMDEEIRRIIDEAYDRCRAILTEYRPQLERVAEFLLAHETMTAEEFEQVFTPEKGPENRE